MLKRQGTRDCDGGRKCFLSKPFAGTARLIVEGKRQRGTATNAATKNLDFINS